MLSIALGNHIEEEEVFWSCLNWDKENLEYYQNSDLKCIVLRQCVIIKDIMDENRAIKKLLESKSK